MRKLMFTAVMMITITGASQSWAQSLSLRAHGGLGSEDEYDAGGGVAAALTLPIVSRFFDLGIHYTYHTGSNLPVSLSGVNFNLDGGISMVGSEFGPTLISFPILIRISGFIGTSRVHEGAVVGGVGTSTTENKFTIAPGAIVAIPFGRSYAGVEVKYWSIQGFKDSSAVYLTLGTTLGR